MLYTIKTLRFSVSNILATNVANSNFQAANRKVILFFRQLYFPIVRLFIPVFHMNLQPKRSLASGQVRHIYSLIYYPFVHPRYSVHSRRKQEMSHRRVSLPYAPGGCGPAAALHTAEQTKLTFLSKNPR